MATMPQSDPYAKYGGGVSTQVGAPSTPALDDDIPQPIQSVRASDAKQGDLVSINGQDAYVSGFDSKGRPTLSPGHPQRSSTGATSDPYAKYGGQIGTQAPTQPGTQPQPGMSRPEADAFMDKITGRPFAQGAAPGTTSAIVSQQPSFADTMLVDPESPQFGGPIPSSIHPDTRGGRNLVPVQSVPRARQQLQFDSTAPPDQFDQSLPLAQRIANRAGLQARTRGAQAQEISNINDQWKQLAGGKGADLGQFIAESQGQVSPGATGFARSVGKNVASTLADPVTYAIPALGAGGKVAQVGLSTLFAAGAAKQSYDSAGQLGAIWDRDDISPQQKVEMGTDALLNTAMAGMSGAHAVKVSFAGGMDPVLNQVPREYRDAVAQNIGSALRKTGGIIARTAGTVGDVMADIGNSDRTDNPSPAATIRKALPKIPASSANTALPLVRSVADNAGYQTLTAADLLDSAPDQDTGAVSPGLISQAKSEVIAKAGKAAGPGNTIADLSPQQVQPYIQQLDALDDLHDHLQDAQDQETAELKAAAAKGKIPATKAAALVRMGMGAGKVALSASAGPALGRMSRVLLHAYGIPSGFNDLVTGIKGIIGAGGKLSPMLDENINAALAQTSPAFRGSYIGGDDAVQPRTPYQGDTSVQHNSLIFPPELAHGDATEIPDEPNPRYQLAASSTSDPYARYGGRTPPPIDGNQVRSFTSVPGDVTPQSDSSQLPFAQPTTAVPSFLRPVLDAANSQTRDFSQGVGDYAVPRGQHPEDIVQSALMKLSLPALREAARAGNIDYGSSDTHQDLIAKIMDAYAGRDEHLEALAETFQGRRGAVPPGPRQPAPPDQTDYSDIMRQSVDAVNARRAQSAKPSFLRNVPSGEPSAKQPMGRGGEQRTNLDYRARVDAMPVTERDRAIYESPLTGLPNKRAFEDFSPALQATHPHVGYADVDNFKDVNTALGHDGADQVLREIGSLFRQAMAEEGDNVHVFHRSGDEFWFRGTDPAAISRVVDGVNEGLAKTRFTFDDVNGKEVTREGVGLSHGTGSTIQAAEAAAESNKNIRTQQGKRQASSRDNSEVHPMGAHASGATQAQINNISKRQSLFSGTDKNVGGTVPASQLQRGEVAYVDPKDVNLAPDTFQYKTNVNEKGVTNQFADTRKFNEDLAGVVHAYRDPETGALYAVNGHHRTELAQRTNAPRMLIHTLDVDTPEQARAVGALQNIAEGQVTAVDAAKFLRDTGMSPDDMTKMGISLSASKVTNGLALSKLEQNIFNRVATGKMGEGRGVAIGQATSDPAQQEAIVKLLDKREAQGKNITDSTVAELARFVANSGNRYTHGPGLFGDDSQIHSLAIEKAEISSYVKQQIAKEKRVFGAVSSESKAKTLGSVQGQQIQPGENARISSQAAQHLELYNRLSSSAGPISNILENAAKELTSGYQRPEAVKSKAYESIRQELSKTLAGQ